MIDFERLTYPGGVAVATILKSPGAGVHKALLLLSGLALSGIIYFFSQYMSQIKGLSGFEYWNLGASVGMPEYMNGIWYISLMTIGVGFISGKGGFYFIIGGFVCYWILAPILAASNLLPTPQTLAALEQTMPDYMRLSLFRPVGIGMLIGGALAGIVLALPLIVSAVRSMQTAAKMKTSLSPALYRHCRCDNPAFRRFHCFCEANGPASRRTDGPARHHLDLGCRCHFI